VTDPEPVSPGAAEPDVRLPLAAYRRMAFVLRSGLVASLLLLAGGIAEYFAHHPGATAQAILATNPIAGYLSLSGLARGIGRGSSEALLTLGVLVLVATPIVRVVSGFYYFQRGGERTMATITLLVFVLLLFGLLVFGPFVK